MELKRWKINATAERSLWAERPASYVQRKIEEALFDLRLENIVVEVEEMEVEKVAH